MLVSYWLSRQFVQSKPDSMFHIRISNFTNLTWTSKIRADWEHDMPWCFPGFSKNHHGTGWWHARSNLPISDVPLLWGVLRPMRKPKPRLRWDLKGVLSSLVTLLWVLWHDDDDLRKLLTIHIWGWILTWYEGPFYRYIYIDIHGLEISICSKNPPPVTFCSHNPNIQTTSVFWKISPSGKMELVGAGGSWFLQSLILLLSPGFHHFDVQLNGVMEKYGVQWWDMIFFGGVQFLTITRPIPREDQILRPCGSAQRIFRGFPGFRYL